MNFLRWRTPLLALIALQLGLAGCATPQRLSAVPVASMPEAAGTMGTTRFLVSRESDSFKAEAMRSLEKEKVFLASKGWSPEKPLPPVYLLAISGGGDNGAYGAGFLSGWSATGRRPEFKVVTGISTGALIAPFAFLGPKYDYVLQRVYTETSQKDIFKKRGTPRRAFWRWHGGHAASRQSDRQLRNPRAPWRDCRTIYQGPLASGRHNQLGFARARSLEHDRNRREQGRRMLLYFSGKCCWPPLRSPARSRR